MEGCQVKRAYFFSKAKATGRKKLKDDSIWTLVLFKIVLPSFLTIHWVNMRHLRYYLLYYVCFYPLNTYKHNAIQMHAWMYGCMNAQVAFIPYTTNYYGNLQSKSLIIGHILLECLLTCTHIYIYIYLFIYIIQYTYKQNTSPYPHNTWKPQSAIPSVGDRINWSPPWWLQVDMTPIAKRAQNVHPLRCCSHLRRRFSRSSFAEGLGIKKRLENLWSFKLWSVFEAWAGVFLFGCSFVLSHNKSSIVS